jgi:hypothetical protein
MCQDPAIVADEQHIQRYHRILHPHADRPRGRIEKQHAGIRRHPLTIHQPLRPLL